MTLSSRLGLRPG